ncbi:unnamed protein product [Prorocentrum cordatum]|uniref:Uncharacterized protein n=1 Tax=Prorocentrum cordatum TaxID=2364126 RepID=A0ABN9V349_9DINO|nr:unnamed protein product [Polarella glacialis]
MHSSRPHTLVFILNSKALARGEVPEIASVGIIFPTWGVTASGALQYHQRSVGQLVRFLKDLSIAPLETWKPSRALWAPQRTQKARAWGPRRARGRPPHGVPDQIASTTHPEIQPRRREYTSSLSRSICDP